MNCKRGVFRINKQDIRAAMLVTTLIFIAVACRFFDMYTDFRLRAGWIRSLIYIGLFSAWGISARSRILQKRMRYYLTAVAALMVFWNLARTVKYLCLPPLGAEDISRYIWYLYYLPMLFIPLLALLVAIYIGRPEDARLPGWTVLLYIPTASLLVLVLTNDLHQTVFTFPQDAVKWLPSDYAYGAGYYAVIAWMLICAVMMLAVMLKKCRIPYSRRLIWMPVIPVIILLVYSAFYYSGAHWLRFFAGDVTVTICLMYTATLELCIRCSLIRSNTRYRELFDASTIGAQITDDEYEICLSSKAARQVSADLMRRTESGPVLLDGGIRLCAAPIRGGHILWQENISDLLSVLKQLGDRKKELQKYSDLLEEENKQKRRKCELEEQKRLYAAMRRAVAPEMERLNGLVGQLGASEDEETLRMLHGRIAVAGAYIKRRSNLVFLSDKTGTVAAGELLLCLNESASNLRLAGISCGVSFDLKDRMDGEAAGMLYDFFENVVEITWESLTSINVFVTQEADVYSIMLMLEGSCDPAMLPDYVSVEQDEDVCYCRLNIIKGGAVL